MNGKAHAACCAVGRGSSEARMRASPAAQTGATDGMRHLAGGVFLMGTDDPTFPEDGEGPVREVALSPFWIDPYAVSNVQFAAFVAATGYRTDAERYGWSFVFYQALPTAIPGTRGVGTAPWWRQVHGARWDRPEGPQSSLEHRLDHPVVHVSWNDAAAYAAWSGKRLPTEAEWEYAARGGLEQKRYPWGDRLSEGKKHRCNIWQGTFPSRNTCKDGFMFTAPVNSFEPNGYGLYNMVGNVWEWCSDDWSAEHEPGALADPKGPPEGQAKVIKGGSYLCHSSYCNRYRVAARTFNTPDSSTAHMGFRLARNA